MALNKFELYERSVQSAESHVDFFVTIYKELHQKYPKHLREDFCGTFQIAYEWVRRNRNNTALGLDLDPAPLAFGRRKHFSRLNSDQKSRLKIKKADVLVPTTEKQDLIYAGNFSFFIFKTRALLLNYFQSCLKSLRPDGTLLLEIAGGPSMISTTKERKTVSIDKKTKFMYIWDQKDFDPISHDAKYAIHFKLPNGKMLKNAFEYDWRLWTIPETRDVLKDAGFSQTHVYWETSHRGKGTGEYVRSNFADNAYGWIAYIVAVK